MYLTEKEERMLNGEEGEAVRVSLELLTRIGSIYGAERLVEIKSVHAAAVYHHLTASVELMEKYADLGGKFRVPTTADPTHGPNSFDRWEEFPEPEEQKKNATRLVRAIEKMGVIPNWSCTPYFQGNLPRFGECVSWVESSAISFANSVLGARTNRTSMGVEIASALTGRAPEFGLLLEENRGGNVLVVLEYVPETLFDYSTIGFIIGKTFSDKVPVINHLPRGTTANQLKVMGAAAASRGTVPLYHAVGITPEARTLEEAFKGKKPEDQIKIGDKEVKEAIADINTYSGGHLDAVLIGCPHPTVEEVGELAHLLRGKRVRKDIKFCLFASNDVINWSRGLGYIEIIEASGVDIFEGDCINFFPITLWKWKNIATNSAKYANILPSDPTYVDVLYVDLKGCVEAGTL